MDAMHLILTVERRRGKRAERAEAGVVHEQGNAFIRCQALFKCGALPVIGQIAYQRFGFTGERGLEVASRCQQALLPACD